LAPVEILVASLLGKLLVLGCCLLVAVAVLWWAAPKFINFLKTVSGHSPNNPKLKPIHVVLGITPSFSYLQGSGAAHSGKIHGFPEIARAFALRIGLES
jgi:hypothetical protein